MHLRKAEVDDRMEKQQERLRTLERWQRAVSYTHLDVYKRQLFRCPNQFNLLVSIVSIMSR